MPAKGRCDTGDRNLDVLVALEVPDNPLGAEVELGAKPENLAYELGAALVGHWPTSARACVTPPYAYA